MSADRHDTIAAAAGDWFARRESGEWTASDQERFEAWLNESALHRVAFLRIEHSWERAGRLKALATGESRAPSPGKWARSPFFGSEVRRSARRSRSWKTWRWAAALALAAGIATVLITSPWLLGPKDSYCTPVGGLETVPLADGSTLTLNTNSAVTLSFTPHERGVELKRGEAFFEVAKDKNRPFVVRAGDHRVIAVGTRFSVRREGGDGDIQVIVTEGTVRMESRAPRAITSSPTLSETSGTALGGSRAGSVGVVLLPAGTIAHASGADVLVQKRPVPAAEETLSWRQGVLVFHDVTLAEAVAEFNRYNARQIEIQDPKVAALTVAGSFRATNVDAFVRLLEKGYPIRTEIGDDHVLLTGR